MAESPVPNPFARDADAERYASARPFFHLGVLRRLAGRLSLGGALGLDVGCGTGLSSLALARACRRVLGVDASRAMIGQAVRNERVDYAIATAERLPARNESFDVITLGQVAHWVDWAAFLDEGRRVTRPGGWVVVYDHFLDPADGDERGRLALRLLEEFYARYPRPPRHAPPLTSAEEWSAHDFQLLHDEHYRTTMHWSPREFVAYLMTQSNVNAALAGGLDTIEGVRRWLGEAVRDLFPPASEGSFAFDGPIVCARRRA